MKIKTLHMPEAKVAVEKRSQVLAEYRRRYQRTQAEAEQAMLGVALPNPQATSVSGILDSGQSPRQTIFFNRRQKW